MNMGLLAADLSLGSPSVKVESGTSTSVVVRQNIDKHHMSLVKPINSAPACDLRALELYHKALEDERVKIQAFEKELPFCMQLLENAIEASKEQLEERLACKLNTPLHDPPLAAATHEFVCNYTSSFTAHRRLVPALGEINLHFKRKWTSAPPSSMFDHSHIQSHEMTSGCNTKWLLPQNTKLSKNEDMPVTCIKGSIKVQEFSIPEHALPAFGDSQKLVSEVEGHSTDMTFNCVSATHSHDLHLLDTKQALSLPAHPYIQEDKYVLSNTNNVNNPDGQHGAPAMPKRSLNDAAGLDVNGSSSICSRPLMWHAKLGPKELQISTAMSSPLSKSSSHSNMNAASQSGAVQRKPRRCWSPELHQRFLSALNHLGGCQVATPKQIRELMNVEGLTNDEVKSHLQKFRLHMRRPNGVVTNPQGNAQRQAAAAGRHLVVFGHIWVPPEYGDEHHQHAAANANIDIISSEFSTAANGAMELMQGFRSSGSELGTANMEHGNYGHAQLGHVSSVQCRDVISAGDNNIAQAGLLRLCQEEYCSDEERGLKNMQHHEEGNEERTTSYNAAHVASEREASICMHRQQQQQQGRRCEDDGSCQLGIASANYKEGTAQIDHVVKHLRVEELVGAEEHVHAEELETAGN